MKLELKLSWEDKLLNNVYTLNLYFNPNKLLLFDSEKFIKMSSNTTVKEKTENDKELMFKWF